MCYVELQWIIRDAFLFRLFIDLRLHYFVNKDVVFLVCFALFIARNAFVVIKNK